MQFIAGIAGMSLFFKFFFNLKCWLTRFVTIVVALCFAYDAHYILE